VITLKLASVVDLRSRLEPLLLSHRQEMPTAQHAPIPLPDWDLYYRLDAVGRLILVAAEDGDELVGYCSFILAKMRHDRELTVVSNDAIYLKPERRGAGVAARLIAFCESEAVRRGADVVSMTVKVQHNFGPLLTSLGYENDELVFHKRLKR
jgi:GNAT superfamily N-acetyltransferase